MAIKTCKYKNYKNDNKYSNYNTYKMSGSGGPGKWRQKASILTSVKPKNKYRAKVALGVATGAIVPYGIYKALKYLPSKLYHKFNSKTESGQTYKEEYGLKNKSHVEKARRALVKYDTAKDNLIQKYGKKIIQTEQGPIAMNIMERYDYAKSIIKSPTAPMKDKEKAHLLIKYINKKLQGVDYKSQKILNYIRKKGKSNQIKNIHGRQINIESKKISAAEKIRQYIYQIKSNEEV